MSRALACAAALAGCVPAAPEAFWQPAAERPAPLAIEASLIPAAPRTGPILRVASYNVHFGAEVEAIAAALSAPPFDRGDVFLLQEIESHPGEGGSRAARIAELTSMAYVYLPSRVEGAGTHGMAILARRELGNVRFMDLPRFDTSLRTDGRVALAVEVAGVDIVNIHLRLQLGISERILQLAPATRDLAAVAIVGGDFNTNPYAWVDMLPVAPTDPITDLDAAAIVDGMMAERGFDAATATSGPTHHSLAGQLRLDSIYSRGLEPGPPSVERSIDLSDHWPVWVDLVRSGRFPTKGHVL